MLKFLVQFLLKKSYRNIDDYSIPDFILLDVMYWENKSSYIWLFLEWVGVFFCLVDGIFTC